MLSFGKPNVERLKRRRDVVRLLGALRHQEPAIRQRALEALEPLADSLNPGMRRISLHQSVEILERIGDENAFEALLRLLTSSLPEEVLEDGIILEYQIREALETVMKRSLGKIATEPLRNAARLRNPKVLIRPMRDGEPYYGLECREEEIDCSNIRELAQQELARRPLS